MATKGNKKNKTYTIHVEDIEIEVQQKSIKNIYLRVMPVTGKVRISAPLFVSEKRIYEFAQSKAEWIRRNISEAVKQEKAAELEYIDGDEIKLWGKAYQLRLIETSGKQYTELNGDEIALYVHKESLPEHKKKIIYNWYKDQLRNKISELAPKCEAIVERNASEWRIRNMKTRWGSCNISNGRICINLKLAEKTPDCLEYVMIHELVHLHVRNHDSRFKAYMDRFCPDWRIINEKLNGRKRED